MFISAERAFLLSAPPPRIQHCFNSQPLCLQVEHSPSKYYLKCPIEDSISTESMAAIRPSTPLPPSIGYTERLIQQYGG